MYTELAGPRGAGLGVGLDSNPHSAHPLTNHVITGPLFYCPKI